MTDIEQSKKEQITENELRNNLLKCSKLELIDMILIQWRGLGDISEQIAESQKGVTL